MYLPTMGRAATRLTMIFSGCFPEHSAQLSCVFELHNNLSVSASTFISVACEPNIAATLTP